MMLEPWADVFGDANIILRIYDRERLKDNDIVSDFFSLLGCEICKSSAAEMRINRAFDPKTLEFLMLINKHVPVFKDHRWNPDRTELTDALEAISTEPNPTLSVEELRRFFALFERSNAAIARRFLGRADGVLFTNVSFVGRGETADLTVENAVEIAAHLWRWKGAHRQGLPSSSESREPTARKQNSMATEADIEQPTRDRPLSQPVSRFLMNGNSRSEVLRQKLWRGTFPLEAFPRRLIMIDKQGWNSNHQYLSELIEHRRPNIVVEVGVWKGGSVITMARKMKEMALDAAVIAVDTWLGSFENWTQKEWFAELAFENGYPKLFHKFMANLIDEGVQDYVIPLPLDSLNACRVLGGLGIKVDAIHLDGCHDYGAVFSDLKNWWSILDEEGTILIDDYYQQGDS
jgi:hypothetical protein